jgi:hypothetical protein
MTVYVLIKDNEVIGVCSSIKKLVMNRASHARTYRNHITDYRVKMYEIDVNGERHDTFGYV